LICVQNLKFDEFPIEINVPIDYSKPSKPYKEEAERIKVQEQAKKK